MRALGLDIGEKRIGVALSDPGGILATALTVLETRSEDDAFNRIVALAQEHDVEHIVVGMPFSLDGSLGPQARRVQSFIEKLGKRTELPVVAWDERFSTVDAERVLVEAGVKREKRKKHLDSVAAAIVLQGYLDRQRADS
jgi:putative Holliday junction resolvase